MSERLRRYAPFSTNQRRAAATERPSLVVVAVLSTRGRIAAAFCTIYSAIMSSSDTDSGNTVTPLRPSRKRRPEKWEKNVKKVKRNSGQSYVGVTKKLVPDRKIG